MRAICPGSFDPLTYGHLDVIGRARHLFGEVQVAVGTNSAKNSLFDPARRVELARAATADLPGVEVVVLEGLLVDHCLAHGIDVVVKGLRFAADFDYELQMAQLNRQMTGIETVLLPAAAQWGQLSSTLVRDIARHGRDVSAFVPPAVQQALAGLVKTDRAE